MSDVILKVENLSKQYRLGTISSGTISHDLNRWWANIRGKEDPYLKIGETNDRSSKGESEYVWALKDINFEVKRGEVLGIIGKNGAGKSTLLKILSKVTSPTTGSIKTKGRIASLLEVGTGFHPEMTGKENIYLNGAILGMTKKEIAKKFDEIVEFSGCQRYIDTPVKRYSSGMKVRLAFAVAAFLEPDILVVDEVLAVGDAEFQKKAIGKMQDISQGEGRTVLFVSHDMGAVQNLCQSILVLDSGRIDFSGNCSSGISFYFETIGKARETDVDLSKRNRLKGNSKVKFEKVVLLKKDNNSRFSQVSNYKSSDTIAFELVLQSVLSFRIENLNIAITINSIFGSPITVISSEFSNDTLIFDPGRSVVKCSTSGINLRKGEYYINLYLGDNAECFDYLEKAVKFEVLSDDFFGTGKYPSKNKHGLVLTKCKFTN